MDPRKRESPNRLEGAIHNQCLAAIDKLNSNTTAPTCKLNPILSAGLNHWTGEILWVVQL